MNEERKRELYQLHDACASGQADVVEELISNFSRAQRYLIDLPDPNGQCPLFHAIRAQNIQIVKYLLSNKARITHSVVFFAVRQANRYILQLLAEHGANFSVHTEHDQWTVLHDAVCLHNNDVIDFLVGRGLDVDVRDANGTTPLCLALSRHNVEAVRKLLALNADVNQACDSRRALLPVQVAASIGHYADLDELIDRTTQLNTLTDNRQTTLDLFLSYVFFYNNCALGVKYRPFDPNSLPSCYQEDPTAYFIGKLIGRGARINHLNRAYRRGCRWNVLQTFLVLSRYRPATLFCEDTCDWFEELDYLRNLALQSITDTIRGELSAESEFNHKTEQVWLVLLEVVMRLHYGQCQFKLGLDLNLQKCLSCRGSAASRAENDDQAKIRKAICYLEGLLGLTPVTKLRDICKKAILVCWARSCNNFGLTLPQAISRIPCGVAVQQSLLGLA